MTWVIAKRTVQVLQGVSIDGENLIITFQVTEGPLTRIAGVEVKGNKIYTDERIRRQLRTVIGAPYSRSYARADGDRVVPLYSREGYVNARVDFSIVELPKKGDEEQVRLIYSIADEGDKVFINQSSSTALPATLIRGARNAGDQEGDSDRRRRRALRADRISEAERELYLTDAYRQVVIRTEPAGETTSGLQTARRDHRRRRETAKRDGLRRWLLNRRGRARPV